MVASIDGFLRRTPDGVLRANQLGAFAREILAQDDPRAAARFDRDAAAAVARSMALSRHVQRIESGLAEAGVPLVLLKGAALAETVYPDPSQRPMGDVDAWIRPDCMPQAVEVLSDLGYRRLPPNPSRPPALQRLAQGEIQFRPADGAHGLIELHWGPFPGWWLRRVARADAEACWQRAVPLGRGRHARRLAAEDLLIHVALHQAVQEQFSSCPLRCLIDLALIARTWEIDWDLVGRRCRDWRVATAIWTVLDLAERLVGLPGAVPVLSALEPSLGRRKALASQVSVERIVAGSDLRGRGWRRLLLLLLVDRARDAARLVGRTLWPELDWIAARYDRPVGHWRHLWFLLRHREV